MKISSSALKKEFEELFKQQQEIEASEEFQNKRRKYDNINSEVKHGLNTLSEIFQDADLLARISKEAHNIMRSAAERPSRVRHEQDLITFKKPQAKDVITTRKIDDDLEGIYEILEGMINDDNEYINPLAPKTRKYIGESEMSQSDQSGSLLANSSTDPAYNSTFDLVTSEQLGQSGTLIDQLIGSESDTSRPQSQSNAFEEQSTIPLDFTNTDFLSTSNIHMDTLATSLGENVGLTSEQSIASTPSLTTGTDPNFDPLSFLHIPSILSQSTDINQSESKDKSELEIMFEETSKLIAESPLQTVGSKHLHTCLPRQSEPNAFIYVKEDYNPTKPKNLDSNWTSALDDTLLTVLVFNPTNSNLKFQQIEILGSQKVSDIRDVIYCQSDFSHNNDHKDSQPDGEILNTFEKKTSRSFFYAERVFYLDTRYPEFTLEYYNSLIEGWMTKKGVNREVFQFSKQPMHETVLDTIEFQLYRPFAFLHQDTCEHVMMVTDMRLISPDEYKSKEEFPRATHNLRYDRFKCSMCTIYPATKVTYDDIISGFSPCYFCDICFESFHHNHTDVQVSEYNGTPGGDSRRRYAIKKKQ